MKPITIIAILLYSFLGYCRSTAISHDASAEQSAEVNKIIVRLPAKVLDDKDDNLLMEIIDNDRISKIVIFVNKLREQKSKWLSEKDRGSLAPSPFIRLEFFDSAVFKYHFGMGDDFFSFSESDEYSTMTLTFERKEEFLK